MFFDGGREKRAVSLAGSKKARASSQETALKSAQAKRQRDLDMKRYKAAIIIQKKVRQWVCTARSKQSQRGLFDDGIRNEGQTDSFDVSHTLIKRLCYFYTAKKKYMGVIDDNDDNDRLVKLLPRLEASLTSGSDDSGWLGLWVNNRPVLLRSLVSVIFSYLHTCISNASLVGGVGIASRTLNAILQYSPAAVGHAHFNTARLHLLEDLHEGAFDSIRCILSICSNIDSSTYTEDSKFIMSSCGATITSFVLFLRSTLAACRTAALPADQLRHFSKLEDDTRRSIATSVLSSPQVTRCPAAAQVLLLFEQNGYSEWLHGCRLMAAALTAELDPGGDVSVPAIEKSMGSGRFRHVLYYSLIDWTGSTASSDVTLSSVRSGNSVYKRNLKGEAIPAVDKFGAPTQCTRLNPPQPSQRRTALALSTVRLLANVSDLSLFKESIDWASLSDNKHVVLELLYHWLAMTNQLLSQHRLCEVPIHVAMHCLDYTHISSCMTAMLRPVIVHVGPSAERHIYLVPNSIDMGSMEDPLAAPSSDMEVDDDDARTNADQRIPAVSTKKMRSAGEMAGLYIEEAIAPLFNISAMDELAVWNHTYNRDSRQALLRVITFVTSALPVSILLSEDLGKFQFTSGKAISGSSSSSALNLFPFNEMQLLVVEVLARVISSSDNALPGNKTRAPTASDQPVELQQVLSYAYSHRDAVCKVMSLLAFSSPEKPLIKRLWNALRWSRGSDVSLLDKATKLLQQRVGGGDRKPPADPIQSDTPSCDEICLLYLFCITLSHQLVALQDDELYGGNKSIDPSAGDMVVVVEVLKDAVYHLTWVNPLLLLAFADEIGVTRYTRSSLLADRLCRVGFYQASCRLYNHLSIRNERRLHMISSHNDTTIASTYRGVIGAATSMVADQWTWDEDRHIGVNNADLFRPRSDDPLGSPDGMEESNDANSIWQLGGDARFKFVDARIQIALLNTPQLIAFERRAVVLHSLIEADQRENGVWHDGHLSGGLVLRIRRNEIIQDAFDTLSATGSDQMKQRLRVIFVSEDGHEEAGIDGGGLFKEFLESFMKTAFDPAHNYFLPTQSHELVPVAMASSNDPSIGAKLEVYKFIGKMLAKAVYSEILLEPQLSPVFLNSLLGRVNSIDDLSYLDSQFYKSLMNIKQMILRGDDVQVLGLYFQSTEGEPLVKGGCDIPVTNENALTYIYLLAKSKMNVSLPASNAFLVGFRELVPVSWLRMFNPREMQSILGGELRPLDLDDLQRNVAYTGGYHPSQPYVQMFWEVVGELSPQEQGDFLKFITSCSRQPLLGFGKMNPKIGIQEVPARYPDDGPNTAPRLPSAGTCFNLLKLPRYANKEILREKLKYAINCNTGFELS